MKFVSVKEWAEKVGVAERTARNYCSCGKIDLTYNSSHIEGSKLTHDQTRYIFETNTIGITGPKLKVI